MLAKFIMPDQHGRGMILTTVLGVIGAIVGGLIGTNAFSFGDFSGFNLRSLATAIGGALPILFAYGTVGCATVRDFSRVAAPLGFENLGHSLDFLGYAQPSRLS